MTATLSATPDKIPDGGTTTICISGAAANSQILIKCTDSGGESQTFTIETDSSGNGCHQFTAPIGWTEFQVSGGGASPVSVVIGQ